MFVSRDAMPYLDLYLYTWHVSSARVHKSLQEVRVHDDALMEQDELGISARRNVLFAADSVSEQNTKAGKLQKKRHRGESKCEPIVILC
jgi:hypothetical protein